MLWWTRKRLESSDPGTRATAAARLGEARDRKAVEPLSLALRNPAPEVRRAAATALGGIGDAAAIPALLAGMTDARGAIQEACAKSLGQIGGAAAPALVLFLGDGPVATRKLAARTLAAMGWRPTNRADEVAFAMVRPIGIPWPDWAVAVSGRFWMF